MLLVVLKHDPFPTSRLHTLSVESLFLPLQTEFNSVLQGAHANLSNKPQVCVLFHTGCILLIILILGQVQSLPSIVLRSIALDQSFSRIILLYVWLRQTNSNLVHFLSRCENLSHRLLSAILRYFVESIDSLKFYSSRVWSFHDHPQHRKKEKRTTKPIVKKIVKHTHEKSRRKCSRITLIRKWLPIITDWLCNRLSIYWRRGNNVEWSMDETLDPTH